MYSELCALCNAAAVCTLIFVAFSSGRCYMNLHASAHSSEKFQSCDGYNTIKRIFIAMCARVNL